MNIAVFVLSTGRCGTQWLAQALHESYSGRFRVEHEPLQSHNAERRMLGARSPEKLPPKDAAPILEHLAGVERTLERTSYIECGYPCWSSLPYLAQRFKGRARFVHLTRHPIATAFSWLTHNAYEKPILPHIPEKIMLTPFDEGVAFPEYRERWAVMTPFEKCLYYWLEVHAFGMTCSRDGGMGAKWLRISFENLFGGGALDSLLEFLDLPRQDNFADKKAAVVDQYKYYTASAPNIRAIAQHPRVMELADTLGYICNVDELTPEINKMHLHYMGYVPAQI